MENKKLKDEKWKMKEERKSDTKQNGWMMDDVPDCLLSVLGLEWWSQWRCMMINASVVTVLKPSLCRIRWIFERFLIIIIFIIIISTTYYLLSIMHLFITLPLYLLYSCTNILVYGNSNGSCHWTGLLQDVFRSKLGVHHFWSSMRWLMQVRQLITSWMISDTKYRLTSIVRSCHVAYRDAWNSLVRRALKVHDRWWVAEQM